MDEDAILDKMKEQFLKAEEYIRGCSSVG
ncbi:hypothetical protein RPO_03585 [Rickettsia rickettsii str. Arizona]|uniref:Uncharacterized protein n=1 Tax=Rickettsia rickettsii (strain Sheila Smith) TaxID=392021 RepID=A0A0H3AUQ5_RICRS|nr:hypothetical protein A1G_03575 [Rickettsia rickettsii str. 'Sheila Smith']AFB22180.1 hypothetical protein RPN_03350 [Rickettsia rickettsii str. Brazil]AFB23587.1 hypothetical protein RPL_03575 [Rickettsia rickettsii str. Colombia]AFB24937.1 hypothetical protein RPO_03585 [Rickettsia rickettsii str. Arizona]AFB27621.1 hypothetical protein RPJ_03555 [Rickettsia rickettsii str. Hino]AFB30278.1 hypothetical protein RPM_03560 [Rickettsia rickettsii str. Hauke]AJG33746.1 hypothetical protein RRR